MKYVIVLLCTLLTGAGFYFSTGLGTLWPLAWLAPIPILWLAFRPGSGGTVFLAAWAAAIIGGCNLLPAYLGILPVPALVLGIVGPGLLFAVSVIGARLVMQRLSPLWAVIAFATLWTGFDYLQSLGPDGAALSPAYSQVGMPFLIQGASLFGLWFVTFVLGFFAAGVAASMAMRTGAPVVLAVLLVLVDAGYGTWRMSTAPRTPAVRVGLAADDALIGTGLKADEQSALAVVDAYADAARTLARHGASLIVIPEKVAVLAPEWRGQVNAELETVAHIGHATIVIGFDERGGERRNDALIFFNNGAPSGVYVKRHLVPGLEDSFASGKGLFLMTESSGPITKASTVLFNRTAVAICKDMDFPAMLRHDAIVHPTLYAVPAWDFDADRSWHARLAIMRGVENGFAVARAANDGLLTLTDAYGRILAEKPSEPGGMVTLLGGLPRGPGQTLYARTGDAFAWLSIGLAFLLVGLAVLRPKQD